MIRRGHRAPWRVVSWLGLLLLGLFANSEDADRQTLLLVVGAPGGDEYVPQFRAWAEQWQSAAAHAEADFISVGLGETNAVSDRMQVEEALAALAKESAATLWLVFIGHGTFGGDEAKFNLRGPDVSALEMATMLQPFRRPLAMLQCASASGPFLAALSRTNRVVITATQSGHEQNYARFGQYLTETIVDPKADLDKDGQTSLLEAFLTAARRVTDFYESDGRLATEHALLDDNGDRLGTPPEWFEGVRAVKKPAEGAMPDGIRAHQFHLVRSEGERLLPESFRLCRDQLELELESLRSRKGDLAKEIYWDQLEDLMVRLARLYESTGQLSDLPVKSE